MKCELLYNLSTRKHLSYEMCNTLSLQSQNKGSPFLSAPHGWYTNRATSSVGLNESPELVMSNWTSMYPQPVIAMVKDLYYCNFKTSKNGLHNIVLTAQQQNTYVNCTALLLLHVTLSPHSLVHVVLPNCPAVTFSALGWRELQDKTE